MNPASADPPPSVALQLLMLTLIFAIGLAGGWVAWGRDGRRAPPASEMGKRQILLGKGGGGGAIPSSSRSAPSASLNRIFQALTIADADARFVELISASARCSLGMHWPFKSV